MEAALALKSLGDYTSCEEALLQVFRVGRRDDKASAAFELALLYCQLGRAQLADPFLAALGYRFRIHRALWSRVAMLEQDSGSVCCFDNALPAPVFDALKVCFAPG